MAARASGAREAAFAQSEVPILQALQDFDDRPASQRDVTQKVSARDYEGFIKSPVDIFTLEGRVEQSCDICRVLLAVFVDGRQIENIVDDGEQRLDRVEFVPADATGVNGLMSFRSAPNGAYAYSYFRNLSNLYLVEGLK